MTTSSPPLLEWTEHDLEAALLLLVMLPLCCAALLW